jgi:hypothetical protein
MNPIMTRTKVPKRRKAFRDSEACPNKPKDAYPDFALLRRSIFGKRKSRTSGASLASEERGTN